MKNGTMKTGKTIWIFTVLAVLFLVQGIAIGEDLKATPDHFDFGTIKEGEPAAVTVEIENTGTAPVDITNVRTS